MNEGNLKGQKRLVIHPDRIREVRTSSAAGGFYAHADGMRPPDASLFYGDADGMRPPDASLFYGDADGMRPPDGSRF